MPLTYDKFFSVLRDRIGQKILNADHRCWVYLLDFITTIQNLQKREAQMNKESLDFFRTHERTVLEFYWKLQELEEYLRSKTKEVASELRVPSCFTRPRFWVSLSDKSQTQIHASVSLDTTLAGMAVRVDTWIAPGVGWQIEVWPVDGDQGDRTKLMNWLATNGIELVRRKDNLGLYAEFKDFSVDEKSVRDKLQELLDKISAAIEKKKRKA